MTSKENMPFAQFASPISKQSPERRAITKAYLTPETACVPLLLEAATLAEPLKKDIATTAKALIEQLRKNDKGTGVEGLVREFSLSSEEGTALMCLAEALLRIPDNATRDALISDKIAGGDWKSHIGRDKSLFVNAASWALVMTGKLAKPASEKKLASTLTQLINRAGEPIIRKGVDYAMRMMGEQFVRGQTIESAIKASKPLEERGFRYSYDMLGEAATTKEDADRYLKDYETAIHAIGKAAAGRGLYKGPGISIKLSALHPRYSRAQADRVMSELLPIVKKLAVMSKEYNIGFNIDAEEADRLEISLDILEALCFDDALKGWDGIGFVVQAYGRRCSKVLDYIIDLARRSKHRIMLRLVKGAYWDSEIKKAQIDGLESYPVFTRKVYTDVSYIANARKLLAAPDAVFPQFATHNAQTLATIYHLADPSKYTDEQYEFQCLHGMGESLYNEVIGPDKLARPARIYAPVGTHETLLAYLVRRLLENGANSSFVHRIADKTVTIDEMVADPADVVRAMKVVGEPHELIIPPHDIYGKLRENSKGYDLANEITLENLQQDFIKASEQKYVAAAVGLEKATKRAIYNPADLSDIVGEVHEVSPKQAVELVKKAEKGFATWSKVAVEKRALMLDKAADLMQERMPMLMALCSREAGKSIPNAIAEVREAIDFLRFYAGQARSTLSEKSQPLGPVVCISPWNFPLAIFIGQVAAALVAGNSVLAKPAEETPLIAAQAIDILYAAGVPQDSVILVPGDGAIGAALIGAKAITGALFTGSTEVAKLIQKELASRLTPLGRPIPLIAETGGQNAMIVDSSALAEQVVFDVISSAFDSAGQRCSALRVLFLQDDVADRILNMLKGALNELRIGKTDRIGVDVGPVITEEAQQNIENHVSAMEAMGYKVSRLALSEEAKKGHFVQPTIIEMDSLAALTREVFGPILHVIRFKRDDMDGVISAINNTGYGLTFGLHTRRNDLVEEVTSKVEVGNYYVNRNVIGAIVGSQPFGGRGLSGTGPKAGGFIYLNRLLHLGGETTLQLADKKDSVARTFAQWLHQKGEEADYKFAQNMMEKSRLGISVDLPGPVGEDNIYAFHPRGLIYLFPQTKAGLYRQLACALATGNKVAIDVKSDLSHLLDGVPASVSDRIAWFDVLTPREKAAGALIEGEDEEVVKVTTALAQLSGPLLLTQAVSTAELSQLDYPYALEFLLEETSTSINTAAAGGNANLMAIG